MAALSKFQLPEPQQRDVADSSLVDPPNHRVNNVNEAALTSDPDEAVDDDEQDRNDGPDEENDEEPQATPSTIASNAIDDHSRQPLPTQHLQDTFDQVLQHIEPARTLQAQGQSQQADIQLSEALNTFQAKLHEHHPDTVNTLLHLAQALQGVPAHQLQEQAQQLQQHLQLQQEAQQQTKQEAQQPDPPQPQPRP